MGGRSYRIAAIVEGDGEQVALPGIIRRWLRHEGLYDFMTDDLALCAHGVGRLRAAPRAACDRGRQQQGVEYFVGLAVKQRADAILVVLDADDQCAHRALRGGERLGPEILQRARVRAPHIPVGVVIADPEFEGWFLMPPCLQALKDAGELTADQWPTDPFNLSRKRDCKATLCRLLGRKYAPSVDQEDLSRHLRFTEPFREASRSFKKLLSELERLTEEVRAKRG